MTAALVARGDVADAPGRRRSGGPPGARLHGIDGLRFGAAAAVLLHHYVSRWSTVWGAPPEEVFGRLSEVFAYAAIAPEQFFVVSGFVVLMTAWGRGVPEVLASRVGRLYPAYWAAVLLTGLLLLVLWPEGKPITPGQVAVNLTMLQAVWDVPNVDGVYWTLWVELRFYALVLLLVAAGVTRRRVLATCAIWPPLAVLAHQLGLEPWSTILLGVHAPYFAGGMALYLLYRGGRAVLPACVLALDVGLAVHYGAPRVVAMIERNTATDPSIVVVGALVVLCFAGVAVLALTRLRDRGGPVLVTLGALTYPLYLLHEHWGWWVISSARPALGVPGALLAAVIVAVGLAVAVHHGVERRAVPALRAVVLRVLTSRARPLPEGEHHADDHEEGRAAPVGAPEHRAALGAQGPAHVREGS